MYTTIPHHALTAFSHCFHNASVVRDAPFSVPSGSQCSAASSSV